MSSSAVPAVIDGPRGSAAVAGGSREVVEAAAETLAAGGSAVDGALAGAFAAVMSEPVLASLGGGGFLMWSEPKGAPRVLDFFVDVPGLGAGDVEPQVETVVVDFARTGSAARSSTQVFHGGWGTVAVPGCIDGYLEAHRLAGRLPLSDVVAPAMRLANGGVELVAGQRTFLHLVTELLGLTEDSRRLFATAERTGRYSNLAYGMLLRELATGRVSGVAAHAYAGALTGAAHDHGGLVTSADLAHYRPEARSPLSMTRGGAQVWTNPPPSVGGAIVLDALGRLPLPTVGTKDPVIDWAAVAASLADATRAAQGAGQVPTGTTHISVVDRDGALAAITTSNGSGSGCVVPGWGVALNNMLGEEDLRPGDPADHTPGTRMRSMMAPTIVDLHDGTRVALGTGGSERIRSALLGVLLRLVDGGSALADAVGAPRLHVTPDGPIHVEPGITSGLDELAAARGWDAVQRWPDPNLYFGGVHAVRRGDDGSVQAVGDSRRTGSVAVVLPDGAVRLG